MSKPFEQFKIDFENPPKPVGIFSGPPITGDELKEDGMAKTLRKKLAREYRDKIVASIKQFPIGKCITVEQLTAIVGRPPEAVSVNAVGSCINYIAKQGMIQRTGRMLKPTRKERHSNMIPEWRIIKYEK